MSPHFRSWFAQTYMVHSLASWPSFFLSISQQRAFLEGKVPLSGSQGAASTHCLDMLFGNSKIPGDALESVGPTSPVLEKKKPAAPAAAKRRFILGVGSEGSEAFSPSSGSNTPTITASTEDTDGGSTMTSPKVRE